MRQRVRQGSSLLCQVRKARRFQSGFRSQEGLEAGRSPCRGFFGVEVRLKTEPSQLAEAAKANQHPQVERADLSADCVSAKKLSERTRSKRTKVSGHGLAHS